MPDEYDLGVLFVHGIGHQAPGDTLVTFGEPIIRWLRRWFARTDHVAIEGAGDEAGAACARRRKPPERA